MDALPPVPKLRGDIILEVFTHKSLRFPGAPTNAESDCGDNERLSVLGEKVLDTAVTFTLFNKKPLVNAPEIESQRIEVLSEANLNTWVANYKLREKVRCSPDAFASLISPEETRLLFCSYVGAVYVQNGVETVQNWIGHLIDPDYEPPVPAAGGEPYTYTSLKTEPMSSPTLPPSTAPLPPLPIDPLAPAKRQSTFLPLFNQTANQRRLAVGYPAQFSGLAHAGRWTVQCVVNGISRGEGSGASKQLAKEEAARQAYYAMGWAPLEYPPNPAPDVHGTGSGSTTGSGSGNGGGSSVGRTSESSAGSGTGSSSARAGAPSSSLSSSPADGSVPLLRVGNGQAAGSGMDSGSGSGGDAPFSVGVDGLSGATATAGNLASVEIGAPTSSSTSSGSAANAPPIAVDAGADSSAGSSASTNSGGSSGSGSGGDANAVLTPFDADASGATATVGDLASVDLAAPTAPAALPSSSSSDNDANSPLAVVNASTSGASPSSDGGPSPSMTGSDSGANAALISSINATADNLAAFTAPAASPSAGCGSSNENAPLAVGNSASFSFTPSFGSGAGSDAPISIGADDSGVIATAGNLVAFTAPAASPASGSGSSNNANAPLADVNAGCSSSTLLSGSSDSGANAVLISVGADDSGVAATAGNLPSVGIAPPMPASADTSSSSTTSSDSSAPLIVANVAPAAGSSSNSGSSSGSGSGSDTLISVGADSGGVTAVVGSFASIAL